MPEVEFERNFLGIHMIPLAELTTDELRGEVLHWWRRAGDAEDWGGFVCRLYEDCNEELLRRGHIPLMRPYPWCREPRWHSSDGRVEDRRDYQRSRSTPVTLPFGLRP